MNWSFCFVIRKGFLFLGIAWLILACSSGREEEIYDYPMSPYIEYKSLEYIDVDDAPDSLLLIFDVSDEERDFGFEDRGPVRPYPYHEFDIIMDSESRFVTFSGEGYVPPYYSYSIDNGRAITEFYSDQDLRPADFTCDHYNGKNYDRWVLMDKYGIDEATVHQDTFYIKRNENRFNIFVDFFAERDGTWEEIDWIGLFNPNRCGINFYLGARSPDHFVDLEGLAPYEYTMISKYTYRCKLKLVSTGFRIVVRDSPLKLRLKVKDRALNESNQIETETIFIE